MKEIRPATFDSIEGAHECMTLLGEALEQARSDIQEDLRTHSAPRTLEALYLVNHKLDQLQQHVVASRRILNDLRSLRRMLFNERAARSVSASKSADSSDRR